MSHTVNAPWTDEEVANLNGYQASGVFHPFTGTRKPNGDETILIATKDGWIEEEGGLIIQTWAHPFMADGSWRKTLDIRTRFLGSAKNYLVRIECYDDGTLYYGTDQSLDRTLVHKREAERLTLKEARKEAAWWRENGERTYGVSPEDVTVVRLKPNRKKVAREGALATARAYFQACKVAEGPPTGLLFEALRLWIEAEDAGK